MKRVKRILALLMAACLVISSSQVSSYATGIGDTAQETAETDEADAASEDTSDEAAEDEAETTNEDTGDPSEDGDSSEADAEEGSSEADAESTEDEDTDAESAEENLIVGVTAASVASAEDEESADMPAVTLTKTVGDLTVTVEAPNGAFAEGVEMTVEVVEGTDAEDFLDAVAEQDFSQYDESYTVIDAAIQEISFYVDGEEVQPAAEVKVTISGLDLAEEDEDGLEADYALIYHMDDNGNVEYVEADQNEQVGLDSYSFTTSEFSAYGVVNVDVEYAVSAASTLSSTTDTITYSYSNTSASITVHFVDSTGATLSSATIESDDTTSYNGTVTLSDLAAHYTVTADGSTYYYSSGLVSASASYTGGVTAYSFRYNNSRWQYRSSSSGNYLSLSSAITDIYLIYSNVEYTDYSGYTVDHIDLAIYPTATLTINGKELTTTITLSNSDFYNDDGSATGNWGLTAYDASGNYYSYTVDSMSTSGSTDSSGNAQVRFDGTFPIGTNSAKIYYTFWFTTNVTFVDPDTQESYTVEMTFYNTFTYYSTDNKCPGLGSNWDGTTYAGTASGMDFTLSAEMGGGSIQIVKEVRDASTDELLDLTTDTTYKIYLYDATENDGDTSNDELEQTVNLTVSDGMATATYSLGAGDYYVVESSPADSVTTADGELDYVKTETYYVVTTYDTSGNTTATTTSTSLESLTSAKAEVDSYTSVVFYVVNYYGEQTVDIPVEKVWEDNEDY